LLAQTAGIERMEPFTLLSALAMVTDRLGLVATCPTFSTSLITSPRLLASIDVISPWPRGVEYRHRRQSARRRAI